MEQIDLTKYDDPAINEAESAFHIETLMNYYDRNILGMGQEAVRGVVQFESGDE